MPENIHTTSLMDEDYRFADDKKQTMIDVSHVSMIFNIANQQLNNLKEYFIAGPARAHFQRVHGLK